MKRLLAGAFFVFCSTVIAMAEDAGHRPVGVRYDGYVALGCVFESLSMLLLTVPIFFPLAQSFGFDMIWFAVIVLLAMEISFTTPPFGLLLFVMQGVAPPGTTLKTVALAVAPYMVCTLLLIALIIVFPSLALFLPSLL